MANKKDAPIAQKTDRTKDSPGKEKKLPSRRNTYIGAIIFISLVIVLWRQYIEPKYLAKYRAPQTGQEAQVQTAGLPKIGGAFSLVDQDSKAVTEADFKGKYMLVYFGYTYCPDVCPTSLSVITDALDLLGEKGDLITPVFITVDPERDDPAALKMYIEHFHPRLVGLTGSIEQIKAVTTAYKAYFAKVGDGYNDDDYSMDHSSITYLMGPDGNFVTHFGHGVEAEPMAKKLAENL
jgi:cytochrome oxidase Cu insertion factor (SCO1/SenC/PrrC family)